MNPFDRSSFSRRPFLFIHLGFGSNYYKLASFYQSNPDLDILIVDRNPPDFLRSFPFGIVVSSVSSLDAFDSIIKPLLHLYEKVVVYPIADYAIPLLLKIYTYTGRSLDELTPISALIDKNHTSSLLSASNVLVPEQVEYSINDGPKSFPCIVKPFSQTDSRGVFLVDHLNFKSVFSLFKNNNESFLCQEYIQGDLYNLDFYISESGPLIVSLNHQIPSRSNEFIPGLDIQYSPFVHNVLSRSDILNLVNEVTNALSLVSGPYTLDFILSPSGHIYTLEVSPFFHRPWLNIIRTGASPVFDLMISPLLSSSSVFPSYYDDLEIASFDFNISSKNLPSVSILMDELSSYCASLSLVSTGREIPKDDLSNTDLSLYTIKGRINAHDTSHLLHLHSLY